jgi:MinD-like ATPase involved in chromosome partitioning or flagellar assembly
MDISKIESESKAEFKLDQAFDKPKRGQLYTFYSYKGGVGRSMALANVAVLLTKWGRKVLVVDWDLEAPGIERYFQPDGTDDRRSAIYLSDSPKEKPGIVDLIVDRLSEKHLDWHDCVIGATIYNKSNPLSFITAGKPTPIYAETVQNINWNELFDKYNIGEWLFNLREEWLEEYDFVLVDSRTGISDIGGICTIILPDVLVLMFTTNFQSIEGVVKVMHSARAAQDNLPVDRDLLVALPVLARDESQTEYDRSEAWRGRIAEKMGGFFRDWLLKDASLREVLQKLYIPYVAYWSFGERLPVFEKEEELEDPRKIGAAYARLATLLNYKLDWKVMDKYADPYKLEETRVELQQKEEKVKTLSSIVDEMQDKLFIGSERFKIITAYLMVLIGAVFAFSVLYIVMYGILDSEAIKMIKIVFFGGLFLSYFTGVLLIQRIYNIMHKYIITYILIILGIILSAAGLYNYLTVAYDKIFFLYIGIIGLSLSFTIVLLSIFFSKAFYGAIDIHIDNELIKTKHLYK